MKNKELNAVHVWKQLEDLLVPRLRLTLVERAIYSHLIRHSHLEGKPRLHFSIASLGRGTCLSQPPVRKAVRQLLDRGVLRMVERTKAGHVVEVRLPQDIRAARRGKAARGLDALLANPHAPALDRRALAASLELTDFTQSKALRQAIHSREHGHCFYCLRRLKYDLKCLDHVVPRVQSGRNSYRNLVSSCMECNARKGEKPAKDFLRWLYRENQLTAAELKGRLRTLDALIAGKLVPPFQRQALSRPPGRPRITPDVPPNGASRASGSNKKIRWQK
jgi:5-methylcytosine-specific restriction endonuclease McrA